MKAIIFDIDGTLIESMAVDSQLYFSSITNVLGPITFRERFNDYDDVTDNGIIAQLIDDNELSPEPSAVDTIRTLFVAGLIEHIRRVGPFPVIHGATQIIKRLCHSTAYCVAIATGGWRKSALLKLESSGFEIEGEFESITYFGDAEWDRRACQVLGWNYVPVGAGIGGIESYDGVNI